MTSPHTRILIFWLALLAVMVRGFIPLGYMPQMKAGGTFEMIVCSLDGPKTVTVDVSFDPDVNTNHVEQQVTDHCLFAMSGSATTFYSDVAHAPISVLSGATYLWPHNGFRVPHADIAGAVQARAPPIFS
jgi:hypothetical protein